MTTTEPRKHSRRPVRMQTPVFDTRTGQFVQGSSRDLSMGGAFVETPSVLPVGTLVELFVGGVGIGVQVLGRIVHVVPGQGFGVSFTQEAASLANLL